MAEATDGTAAAQPAEDIRSAVVAAFDEHAAPEAVQPEPKTEPKEPKETAADDRARGPDGKFVKADGKEPAKADAEPEAEAATEPEATAEPKPDTETQPEAKPDETKSTLELPGHWSQADRERFKALPTEAQTLIKGMIDRQNADYTKKTQGIAALKSEYEPVEQMFTPYRERMKQLGFTPRSLIEGWANVEQGLVSGRGVEIIKGLVDGYRIDRGQIAHALGLVPGQQQQRTTQPDGSELLPQPEGQPPFYMPPELTAYLQRLGQRQDDIDRNNAAAERRAQIARETQAESQINQFKSAADDKGNLTHPYYADVENDMVVLAHGYRARGEAPPPLQQLYETAVWANPSTRERLRTAETQAAQRKQQDEARAKAANAKRASSSVTGAPGAGQTAARQVELTLRQQLESAADDAA